MESKRDLENGIIELKIEILELLISLDLEELREEIEDLEMEDFVNFDLVKRIEESGENNLNSSIVLEDFEEIKEMYKEYIS